MLGAFAAWMLLNCLGIGYWPSLLLAPVIVAITGIVIERTMISRLYHLDHLYGLLLTFGLALIMHGGPRPQRTVGTASNRALLTRPCRQSTAYERFARNTHQMVANRRSFDIAQMCEGRIGVQPGSGPLAVAEANRLSDRNERGEFVLHVSPLSRSVFEAPLGSLPAATSQPDCRLSKTWGRAVPHQAVPQRELRVLQVIPPGKHFGPQRATSIDLDTWDFVRFSRYTHTTTVIADAVDPAFDSVNISCFPDGRRSAAGSPAEHVAQVAAERDADMIVVQQRLPLAAQIARAVPRARVVLHTHNFQKSFADRSMFERALRHGYRRRLYRALDGIIHVSAACARDFDRHWSDAQLPSFVVGNGLDFSEWTPQTERAPEILCVARFTPEKGVLEAAQALARILPAFPDWRARFILAQVERQPRYWAAFNRALNGLGGQVSVETDRPYAEVRHACERAAIALVPSKWIEPFGRTALEAHAGGAALISSGTGGLSEISGETALALPEVSTEAIEAAVKSLLTDETRRAPLARAGAARAREMFDIRLQAARLDQFLGKIAGQSEVAYRK